MRRYQKRLSKKKTNRCCTSEGKETFVGFDREGEHATLKECKVVAEDLLCNTQERNDIQNENQNNFTKDDEIIAKNFEEISKMKEDMLNELSNVRHTEIREPLRKIHTNKKNKRIINLDNYTFESIVRDMTLGMNEYNELVYATAKEITKLCSPKRKKKNARKKPLWKLKIEKEIEHLRRELSELGRA